MADELAVESGFIGDRADDVARLDPVPMPDLDPETLHALVRHGGCQVLPFPAAFFLVP